jgi:D-2-hydroxyacid dehydrogenase (NADP+)
VHKINVLVFATLGQECLRQIADVNPNVRVEDASPLGREEAEYFTPDKKEDFRHEKFEALLAEAEIMFGHRFPEDVIARAPNLKWIQFLGTGVNRVLTHDISKRPVILTHMSDVRAGPVSEVAFGLMMMLAKKAPFCLRNQQGKKWQRYFPIVLRSRTVGIVGLGNIGKEVARLAKAFGMKVIATRRSAKRLNRYVDKVVQRDRVHELLAESDFVVLALPLTPETHEWIGEKELKAMKSAAYLINVGRARTIDEYALIRALEEHWIAGAGLDTHTTEPLSPESRLWELPNVIISPHVGGEMDDFNVRATEFFCDNLKRFINGKRLRNVVNKKRGY